MYIHLHACTELVVCLMKHVCNLDVVVATEPSQFLVTIRLPHIYNCRTHVDCFMIVAYNSLFVPVFQSS